MICCVTLCIYTIYLSICTLSSADLNPFRGTHFRCGPMIFNFHIKTRAANPGVSAGADVPIVEGAANPGVSAGADVPN